MIKAIPIFHPVCVILALIVFYRSITGGVDLFYSVFRGVAVYSVCMILVLLANNIYLLMFKAAKEKSTAEAKSLIMDALKSVTIKDDSENTEPEEKSE